LGYALNLVFDAGLVRPSASFLARLRSFIYVNDSTGQGKYTTEKRFRQWVAVKPRAVLIGVSFLVATNQQSER
jgi:hypothetical protein